MLLSPSPYYYSCLHSYISDQPLSRRHRLPAARSPVGEAADLRRSARASGHDERTPTHHDHYHQRGRQSASRAISLSQLPPPRLPSLPSADIAPTHKCRARRAPPRLGFFSVIFAALGLQQYGRYHAYDTPHHSRHLMTPEREMTRGDRHTLISRIASPFFDFYISHLSRPII